MCDRQVRPAARRRRQARRRRRRPARRRPARRRRGRRRRGRPPSRRRPPGPRRPRRPRECRASQHARPQGLDRVLDADDPGLVRHDHRRGRPPLRAAPGRAWRAAPRHPIASRRPGAAPGGRASRSPAAAPARRARAASAAGPGRRRAAGGGAGRRTARWAARRRERPGRTPPAGRRPRPWRRPTPCPRATRYRCSATVSAGNQASSSSTADDVRPEGDLALVDRPADQRHRAGDRLEQARERRAATSTCPEPLAPTSASARPAGTENDASPHTGLPVHPTARRRVCRTGGLEGRDTRHSLRA